MKEKGSASRLEIARQALRIYLTEDLKNKDVDGEAIATITLIYKENAERRRLLATQHAYRRCSKDRMCLLENS
jgi:metal-responsive CopG/Arc/MetJ family transcriptional regulator